MMNPIKTKSVIVIFLTIALTLGMASTAMSLTGKKVDRRHPAIGQVFLTNQYKDPPSEHIELTGVLISPNTVLVGVQWGAWLVFNDQHTKPDREFDWFFKVGGKIYRVAAIESSGKSSNEMSILRLKRNVKKIKPMPLCQAHHDLKKLNLLFVGYNASKPSKDYKIRRGARITSSTAKYINVQNSKTLLSYAHDMGSPAISYFYPNGRNKNRQECVIGLPERNHKNAKKGRKLIRPDNHRKWLEEAVDGLKWIIPTELKCQQNEVEECYGLTYGCTKIEGEGVGEILGERCGWHISPYRVDPHAPPADTSD